MRRLLAREDGIAMPTALMVLTLCLIITAMVADGADRLSASSGGDQRAKRALAAADAGVSVAIRRLRSLPKLADERCLTNTKDGVLPVSPGVCPTYTENLGGGASFTYRVTPATTGAGGCYEVPGTVIPSGWLRRCITSTGTVGDEIRRVQAQAIVPPRTAAHWMGILGLDHVEIRNSAMLSACWSDEDPGPTIGSNLSVSIDNSSVLNYQCPSKVWGVQMPAGKTPSIHAQAQPQGAIPVTQLAAPAQFTILPPPREWTDVAATNDNARLAPGSPDIVGSGFNWQANNRTLRLNNGGSLRLLRGGDYVFCGLFLDNSSNLDFSTTEKTRIFIDSPRRTGSPCSPSADGFEPQNGTRINWPSTVSDSDYTTLSERAKRLEIYIYDDDDANTVTIRNTVRLAGLVQAERSTVQYVNGSLTWGAVAAQRVILENSGNFQRPLGLLGWGADGPPYRIGGWAQCRNVAPVAGNPQSGC